MAMKWINYTSQIAPRRTCCRSGFCCKVLRSLLAAARWQPCDLVCGRGAGAGPCQSHALLLLQWRNPFAAVCRVRRRPYSRLCCGRLRVCRLLRPQCSGGHRGYGFGAGTISTDRVCDAVLSWRGSCAGSRRLRRREGIRERCLQLRRLHRGRFVLCCTGAVAAATICLQARGGMGQSQP